MNASPFLPSDPNNLPTLQQIDLPLCAVAEFQQQATRCIIKLPNGKVRESTRRYAKLPCETCPLDYKYAFQAFCTARMMVTAQSLPQAEAMVSAQTIEILANRMGERGKHDTIDPRPISVSFAVPEACVNSPDFEKFVDAFSAISDSKIDGKIPMCTKIRFELFCGATTLPISKALRRSAFGDRSISGVSVVVRWSSKADEVRTECFCLNVQEAGDEDLVSVVRRKIVEFSLQFQFALPEEFFQCKAQSQVGYFEKQICDVSQEWYDLTHTVDDFRPSEQMKISGSKVLVRVPNCFVRLSPIALGIDGVTEKSAMHAILLCADGKENEALRYVKTYREGLPPPREGASLLDLHTVGLHTEPVCISAMVSLYAHGGKSGEMLKPSGNWVFKTTAATVAVTSLCDNFFVMSCDMTSILPQNKALWRYMDVHMKRVVDFYHATFVRDGEASAVKATRPMNEKDEKMSQEDWFLLSAIGVDLRSKRMMLGEAISFLMRNGASTELIQLLTGVSANIGLEASLTECYKWSSDVINRRQTREELYEVETKRLKSIADKTILSASKKQVPRAAKYTTLKKLNDILNMLSMKAGRGIKINDSSIIPRSQVVKEKLAKVIYHGYKRREANDNMHVEEIQLVIENYVDILHAIGKCCNLCMINCAAFKDVFIILHQSSSSHAFVHRVSRDGGVEASSIGSILDTDKPCLLIVKMTSEVECVVTPIIRVA